MTGAFPARVQETLQLKLSCSFAKDTYNIEVGWICRTRISVHPGWNASLHMNNSSSHTVDVCFCCVASAEDNFRAHVNLWSIVKTRLINRGKQQAKTNHYILWSRKPLLWRDASHQYQKLISSNPKYSFHPNISLKHLDLSRPWRRIWWEAPASSRQLGVQLEENQMGRSRRHTPYSSATATGRGSRFQHNVGTAHNTLG